MITLGNVAHVLFFLAMIAALAASPHHDIARVAFLFGFVYQIAMINLAINRDHGTPWWHVN